MVSNAPGLYLTHVEPPDRTVRPLRTHVAGFAGIAERGPVGQPVAVTSREQFEALFGRGPAGSYLAHAVRGFFLAGGRTLYVGRVANPYTVASASRVLYRGGLPALVAEAAFPGTWADGLQVAVTPARRAASRIAASATDGRWVEPESLRGFVPGSVVRSGGAEAVVAAVDGRRLTFVAPLTSVPAPGALIESRELHLTASLGTESESYYFLGLHPDHPDWYGAKVNGVSRLVTLAQAGPNPLAPDAQNVTLAGGNDGMEGFTAADMLAGLELLGQVPDVAIMAAPDMYAHKPLPAAPPPPALSPAAPVAAAPSDRQPCTWPQPAPPPAAGPKAPPAGPGPGPGEGDPLLDGAGQLSVTLGLLELCERLRDRVAVLDPPPGLDPQGVLDWRQGLTGAFGAVYWPWFLTADPTGPRGAAVWVPPSGHVAGIYAATDLREGVHRAPANAAVPGLLSLAFAVRETDQAMLNPAGINCLRHFPGFGARVWGARTLSDNAAWRFVPVRRLVSMIEKAIAEATPWAVFEPHTVRLRFQIVNALTTFLQDLWRQGALAGATPEEGFYVKCDDETNPPSSIDSGLIVTEVGVAPVRPAEFIVVRLERSRDAVQVREVELP